MKDIYAKSNNYCLVALTVIACTWALAMTKPVLIPFVFSIFLYSILTPMVSWIQRRVKAPRTLAITLALLVLVIILSSLVLVIATSVDSFIQGASQYEQSINSMFALVEFYMDKFDIDLDLDNIREKLRSLPLLTYAQKVAAQTVGVVGNITLIFIFTLFMLAGEKVRTQSRSKLVQETMTKISAYISKKFALSFATGFLVWVILVIFNVELAFIFGLLTFLLNFIPTIGSIVAVLLPLPVLLLQFQFGYQFWVILALTASVQLTIGNIIEPKLMGETMDLHPVAVLLSLMFWGLIWGIPGMFLAVPITAVLKIVFSRIEATKNFSEILAGRLPTK